MPKFNGQNKKRIDPRYFLNETMEEQAPPWQAPPEGPAADPMARAGELAQQGMDSIDPSKRIPELQQQIAALQAELSDLMDREAHPDTLHRALPEDVSDAEDVSAAVSTYKNSAGALQEKRK